MAKERIQFSGYFSSEEFDGSQGRESVTGPTEIRRDGIRRLLKPLSFSEFVARCGKEAIHIKGSQRVTSKLFSLDRFRRTVFSNRIQPGESGPLLRASFEQRSVSDPRPAFQILPEQVGPILEAGATICATDLHRFDSGLGAFIRGAKAEMGFSGEMGANAYLSQDNCGFSTHFDARVTLAVQVEGTKTWRYSREPAIRYPRFNCDVSSGEPQLLHTNGATIEQWERPAPPKEDDFVEVTLEPGDILCLPAGTWHNAQAHGYSLALNLYMREMSFSELMDLTLRKRLSSSTEWRSGVPMNPPMAKRANREAEDYMRARVADLKTELLRDEYLEALSDTCSRLTLNSDARSNRPVARTSESQGQVRIRKSDTLRISTAEPALIRESSNRSSVLLYRGSTCITFPRSAATLIRKMLKSNEFRAVDATQWTGSGATFSWSDTKYVLELLLKHGHIQRTSPES